MDRLGLGDAAVRAVNPAIVYCSTSGYGQSGPRSQWAGHDLNYLAVGGYLDCSGRSGDGGPALPGATIGDAAGGGMQAVIAILAALRAARRRQGRRVPRRLGRRRCRRARCRCTSTSTSRPARCPGRGTTSSPAVTRATTSIAAVTTAGSRSGRSSSTSTRTSAAPSTASSGSRSRPTTPCRTRSAPTSRPRSRPRRATNGSSSSGPIDTCVSEVASVPELVRDAHLRSRDAFVRGDRRARDVRTGRLDVRGHGPRPARAGRARRDDHRHRLAVAGSRLLGRGDRGPPGTRSRGVTDLPPEVEKLIDQVQYEEAGEFPVERGLRLHDVLVGRERQPAVLGRRRRRRDHRRADRSAHDDLGVVPSAPVVAGAHGARGAAPGRTSTSSGSSSSPKP